MADKNRKIVNCLPNKSYENKFFKVVKSIVGWIINGLKKCGTKMAKFSFAMIQLRQEVGFLTKKENV